MRAIETYGSWRARRRAARPPGARGVPAVNPPPLSVRRAGVERLCARAVAATGGRTRPGAHGCRAYQESSPRRRRCAERRGSLDDATSHNDCRGVGGSDPRSAADRRTAVRGRRLPYASGSRTTPSPASAALSCAPTLLVRSTTFDSGTCSFSQRALGTCARSRSQPIQRASPRSRTVPSSAA